MTQRILGPTGSTKRKRFLLLPTLMVIALSMFWIAGAGAVHDEGVFELEGNATAGVDADNPANPQSQPPGGDDWAAVYAGTDSAEATSFVEDLTLTGGLAGAGDSILSQDTKDIQEISAWTWKQTASTSVQDKADIEHAYAAQYSVDKSGEACGTASATDDCELLYFGADRYSNSGDTVMGFWFFRSGVATVGPDAQGNGTFTGTHTARVDAADPDDPPVSRGDILVVSDFRSGGKAPQIQVYEWVTSGGSAATNLDLIAGGDIPASCTQAPGERQNDPPVPPVGANDNFCATANQFIVTSPWEYEAKGNSGGTSGTGGATTKFGVATFMEGGINLTALGFGDTCFSSFMAETRASHSVTSTLSDFALGTFGACTSGLVTTPADGSGTNLTDSDDPANGLPDIQIGAGSAGVNVTDNASVTIDGTALWTGTVKFFICGPIASGTCDTGGVPAGTKNVSNAAPTATSDVVNLTSVGRYCWRGFFESPTDGVPDATDASTGECFEVKPRQSTLDTQAVASPVDFGQAVQDNATLGNTANQPGTNGGVDGTYLSINATNGAPAGGKITFTLLKADCSTLATGTGTNPQDYTPISGDGTYGPVSFTPDAPGTYHWKAQYIPADGDPNNLGSTHNADCSDSDESVVVSQIPTAITTRQSVLPQDKAVITATGGGNLAGNVRFTLHDSLAECQSRTDVKYDSGDIAISGASPQSASTNNQTTYAIVDGTTHYWNVSYTSTNQAQLGSSSECTEDTTVAYNGNDTGISLP